MSKRSKIKEVVIPKFVNEMYNNWEILLRQMGGCFERDFKYEITKSEKISCLGLEIELLNPITKKPFSIIISDDVLGGGEIRERLNFGKGVDGDLTKIGNFVNDRKERMRKLISRRTLNNLRTKK